MTTKLISNLGDCTCLDEHHKENILNSLSKGISDYTMEIYNTSEAARKLRSEGNISTAELAEHTVESFKYFQDKLNKTLSAVHNTKDCK